MRSIASKKRRLPRYVAFLYTSPVLWPADAFFSLIRASEALRLERIVASERRGRERFPDAYRLRLAALPR